jgi:hemolysin III
MNRTKIEETVNAATHLAWFFLAFVSLLWSDQHGYDELALHSFGAMVAALGSAFYHKHDNDDAVGKSFMRKVDKFCIFVFMGLVSMSFGAALGSVWFHLSSMVLILSLIVAVLYAMNVVKESESENYYMIIALGALLSALHVACPRHLSIDVLIPFGLGLASYAIGYYCYRRDDQLKWMHSFWHVFVMIGWAFHSMAIIELTS